MVPIAAAGIERRRLAERTSEMLISMLALLIACVALAGTVRAADLVVTYDQSQLLRMPRPVSSIIVGNPSIADVTVQAGNLVVVTGKTFGVTNIIALDTDRNIIVDQRVVVRRDDVRTVNLTMGGKRQSYSCTPNCSPTLTIGDQPEYFEMVQKHAQSKTRFSTDGGSSQGPNQDTQ